MKQAALPIKIPTTIRLYYVIYFSFSNGILLPKLFLPTVRKSCSSDFAKILRQLEQFIQTVKGQNNFW